MRNSLDKKRILLIAPKFFDYEKRIIRQLRDNGAEVFFISDLSNTFFDRIFGKIRFLSELYKWKFLVHFLFIGYKFDFVIVIRGEILLRISEGFTFLTKKLEVKKTILYQWDSISLFDYSPLINQFDAVYSFDKIDCDNYNLTYQPLFYFDKGSTRSNLKEKYDLCFVAGFYQHRYEYLIKIKNYCDKNNLKYFFYLYTPFWVYINKSVQNGKLIPLRNIIKFRKLGYPKVIDIIHSSLCVIDINPVTQVGSTMRIIEAIGMRKKIITDNRNVINEKYFNHMDIKTIDYYDDDINLDFISYPSQYKTEVIQTYHISSWLNNLISTSE